MSKPLTVAIIPGFAEGQFHARHLKRALEAAGYTFIRSTGVANIIIAHSGGCYLVPEQTQAKAVIHIGYTYWPGRRLPRAAGMKMADEHHRLPFTVWVRKTALNSIYSLNVVNTLRMARGYVRREELLSQLPPGQIFIRNKYDPYCQPEALMAVAGQSHRFISLPGYHDQLWLEPEPYVNLLNSIV